MVRDAGSPLEQEPARGTWWDPWEGDRPFCACTGTCSIQRPSPHFPKRGHLRRGGLGLLPPPMQQGSRQGKLALIVPNISNPSRRGTRKGSIISFQASHKVEAGMDTGVAICWGSPLPPLILYSRSELLAQDPQPRRGRGPLAWTGVCVTFQQPLLTLIARTAQESACLTRVAVNAAAAS